MKHCLAALAAATAFALPSPAAAFDLASMLALTPGNWSILRDDASGEQYGYVVSQNTAGQLVQTWYRLRGGAWQFDGAQLFVVGRNRITYVGENDGSADWLLEPAFTAPRKWAVNDTVVYKGVQRNTVTGETVPVAQVLSFTAEGITATTPGGTFTGCVKSRLYAAGGGSSRDSVSISCPGRSEVLTWYHKIKDTASPTVMDQSETHSAATIAGGSAGAPFP